MSSDRISRRSSLFSIGYRSALTALAGAWLVSAPLRGDEPAAKPDTAASADTALPHAEGVSLLARDSLAGWNYGEEPHGWTIENGRLTAGERTTRLASSWWLDDFDLVIRWTVPADKPAAAWKLVFSPSRWHKKEELLMCTLCAHPGCGEIRLGDEQLFTGIDPPKATDAKPLETAVRRRGKTVELLIDAQVVATVETRSYRSTALALENAGGGTIEELRLIEPPGKPIFNGKDLSGWWTPGFLGSWQAENGELVCLNRLGNYLRTEREYGNFTLSLEYLAAKGCNSGIGIRTPRDGWPSGDGIELQIYDQPGLDKQSTMALYGNLEPLARADESEKWNRVVVKAQDNLIGAWVNGELVQHADTGELPELKHRHDSGWIGFQDHGGQIRFRNIRLADGSSVSGWPPNEDLPGGSGSWSRTAWTLDRLMNSSELARPTESMAGAVTESLAHGDGALLADLAGPGALVRLWRPANDGRVACYFDDEERPRIECPCAELYDRLPMLSEERQPLLTMVPYERRLRVALIGAAPGEYRIDYVRFGQPAERRAWEFGAATTAAAGPLDAHKLAARLGVHSFGNGGAIPRGYLPAIDYRQHQFGNGRHREHDRYERLDGQVRSLLPSERAVVLEIDCHTGGQVFWWKLLADVAVLRNDDLWLEVSESESDHSLIAGPARYVFAPLANGVGHPNFVVVNSDGPTSFLAMPFTRRLRIEAENRGPRPIGPIRMSASFNQGLIRPPAVCRSRLIARFIPAGTPGPLVEQSGPGRWIGLVCHMPKEGTLGIKRLVVDGEERPGWQAANLDPFLGRPAGVAEFYRPTSGHAAGLAWRWLLMEAVDFNRSLVLEANDGDAVGDRLAWFYLSADAK